MKTEKLLKNNPKLTTEEVKKVKEFISKKISEGNQSQNHKVKQIYKDLFLDEDTDKYFMMLDDQRFEIINITDILLIYLLEKKK